MEQNRMSGFMIGRDPFFFIRNDTALFLSSNTNLDKSSLDIRLYNVCTTFFRCHNGGFIHQIFQIGACKSGRRLGNLIQIHIITHRFALCMNIQNLPAASHIRTADTDFSVKTSRTQNGRVQNIYTVCCRHNNDSLVDTKTIHLYKQLVQCLFSFIMAAAHTRTTASGYRINLIDKHNTRCMLLGILK